MLGSEKNNLTSYHEDIVWKKNQREVSQIFKKVKYLDNFFGSATDSYLSQKIYHMWYTGAYWMY